MNFGISDETTYVIEPVKNKDKFESNTLSNFNVPDGTSSILDKKEILKTIFYPFQKILRQQ